MAKSTKGGFKAPEYQCGFCDKKFKREDTVFTHKCLKRDRYNDRESRQMKEAFSLYMEFMTVHRLSMKKTDEPLMHFIKSKYFNDFYDFADYILSHDILNKDKFITDTLTSGRPVYEWKSHKVLEEWIIKNIRDEHPRRGVERSIMALSEWEASTGNDWWTFFEAVSPERAIMWFEMGKLSPWLIMAASPESGNKLLRRLSDSELLHLSKFLDVQYFTIKQIKYKADIQDIRSLLQEFNL